MKVLYFMNHVDKGGAALALYDLIVELKKNPNIDPIVITGKKNNLNQMLSDIGVESYSAPFKNFMSSYKKPEWLYRNLLKIRYKVGKCLAIRKVEKLVDFSTIDIIHSNLNRIDIGAILAKKHNIPHIWHIREHADGRDFKVISVKENPIEYMNSFESLYVFVSQSVKEVWEKKGLDKSRSRIVYDGVRTELYNAVTNKQNLRLSMIFLGGYARSKGQEDLIDSLRNLKDDLKSKFVIDFYGNGNEKYIEHLNRKIVKNGLVNTLNIYPYENEIWKIVPKYDVGLTCSHGEGFGRVTVEYMMSGLCPIASDGGATPEIVQNGETGIIYRALDESALRNAVIWAINNRENVQKMGQTAEVYAKQNFSMKEHARNVEKMYYEVLKENE